MTIAYPAHPIQGNGQQFWRMALVGQVTTVLGRGRTGLRCDPYGSRRGARGIIALTCCSPPCRSHSLQHTFEGHVTRFPEGAEVQEVNLIILPDDEDADAAGVFVDGKLGSRGYRFLLDTGAARSCIEYDAYTSEFPAIGTNTSSGVFARGSDDLVVVPTIRIGPIVRHDFPLTRSPKHGPRRASLIGMDILKDFSFHFLFHEGRALVNLENDARGNYDFQDIVFDTAFHPYVTVEISAIAANAVWDTGAGITVVDLLFVQEHPEVFQEVGRSLGTDSTGAQVQTPIFTVATTTIGKRVFPPHRVAGVDLSQVNAAIEKPMDFILGYSTLSKASWLFDYPRRRWAVTSMLAGGTPG
jgi:hypothetical protein